MSLDHGTRTRTKGAPVCADAGLGAAKGADHIQVARRAHSDGDDIAVVDARHAEAVVSDLIGLGCGRALAGRDEEQCEERDPEPESGQYKSGMHTVTPYLCSDGLIRGGGRRATGAAAGQAR